MLCSVAMALCGEASKLACTVDISEWSSGSSSSDLD